MCQKHGKRITKERKEREKTALMRDPEGTGQGRNTWHPISPYPIYHAKKKKKKVLGPAGGMCWC
jgi:hypothetical protein